MSEQKEEKNGQAGERKLGLSLEKVKTSELDIKDTELDTLLSEKSPDLESLTVDIKSELEHPEYLAGDAGELQATEKDIFLVNNVSDRRDISFAETNSCSEIRKGKNEPEIIIESEKDVMLYTVMDNPPFHLTLFFAIQQILAPVAGNLTVSLLVSEFVCAHEDEIMKARLMCTTMFMSGVCTLLQASIGIGLPLYQGPSSAYIVPLLAMKTIKEWSCEIDPELHLNTTSNSTYRMLIQEKQIENLQMLSGSLAIAGLVHMLMGGFGIVGLLLRFIGPITIVPAITLIGLFIYKPATRFSETSWGIALTVLTLGLILSLYLANWQSPLPSWSKNKGFHIVRSKVHKSFAILISIIVGWILCAILTVTDVFPNDPASKQYQARTDSRSHVLLNFNWFFFPYPFQFGFPKFNIGIAVNFLLATVISIIDSIGDYYACAKICRAPPPPVHAVNRGILTEGFCSILAGLFGTGHATTTYGGNIGVIGMSKVASRRVFQVLGVIFIFFGIMGKIGALFITVPYPVLGGVQLLSFGIFIGIVLSNLQYIDLNSTRNLAIIGISLLLGLMIPYFGQKNPNAFDTGNQQLTSAIKMLLNNPAFVGGVLALFLDNTIPGTLEERGITTWIPEMAGPKITEEETRSAEKTAIYSLSFLPKKIRKLSLFGKLPFLPTYEAEKEAF